MKVQRKVLAELIASRVLDGTIDSREIESIAAYLLDERRASELSSLMRDVQKICADNGEVEVQVLSAHALSDESKQQVEKMARQIYPAAKNISINSKLEPDVIGGIRVELADYLFERTTKGMLQKFKALAVEGKE